MPPNLKTMGARRVLTRSAGFPKRNEPVVALIPALAVLYAAVGARDGQGASREMESKAERVVTAKIRDVEGVVERVEETAECKIVLDYTTFDTRSSSRKKDSVWSNLSARQYGLLKLESQNQGIRITYNPRTDSRGNACTLRAPVDISEFTNLMLAGRGTCIGCFGSFGCCEYDALSNPSATTDMVPMHIILVLRSQIISIQRDSSVSFEATGRVSDPEPQHWRVLHRQSRAYFFTLAIAGIEIVLGMIEKLVESVMLMPTYMCSVIGVKYALAASPYIWRCHALAHLHVFGPLWLTWDKVLVSTHPSVFV
ncbi:hypothetical protein B0H14DRAFT_2630512 [Mycena olivaceomarginata]|nr:hypothetical protein B0H14DRAFT_2630512 [Mycena olivaceomarginata]